MSERSASLWTLLAAVLNELETQGERPTVMHTPDE